MSILTILVVLVIACLVAWAAQKLLAAFAIPQPIATVVWVIIIVVLVLWILSLFTGIPEGLRFR